MNVEALTSQNPGIASLLAAQAGGTTPTAQQLQADRAALATQAGAKGGANKAPTPEEIKKAASQFEAIILRQLLAPTIEPVMSGEGMGGSAQGGGGGVYGYMLTDTLADSMAKSGGLGWAKLLEKQLSPHAPKADNTLNQKHVSKPLTTASPL